MTEKCTSCYKEIADNEIIWSEDFGNKIKGTPYHQMCYDKLQEELKNDADLQREQRFHDEEDNIRRKIMYLLLEKKRTGATELLSEYIKQILHIYTTRHDDKPQIWVYHKGIYLPNGRTRIDEIIRKIMGATFSTHFNNEVINKIMVDTYIDQEQFFDKNNENPHLIPVQNGILDINKKELQEFSPELIFFNKLPVYFKHGVDCPSIKKFISEIVTEKDARVLQEFVGFILLREYKYEKSLMLTGEGRNGKGKFLMLIKKLFGKENVCSINLQDIEKDQYALGELHGKLANLSGDINDAAIKHSGNFKSLCGRDEITAARKFLSRISFTNYAKFIFAANDIPKTKDISKAFFDRWILIFFLFRFLPQKEIDALKPEERENVRLQNPAIIEQITTPEELTGMLNWALEGYTRLRKQKDFSYGSTSAEVKEQWQRKSDSFAAFCMDCVTEDYGAEIPKSVLREAYQKYCRKFKLKGATDMSIKNYLTTNLGVSESRSSDANDRTRVWVGIRLNADSAHPVQPVHAISTLRQTESFYGIKNRVDTPDRLDKPYSGKCSSCGNDDRYLTHRNETGHHYCRECAENADVITEDIVL